MQLPVCCQCLAPPPAAASKGQRSHWQTGQGPGRVSERGEQEQQAERRTDTRDREEEQVRERLVLREKKKQRRTWLQEGDMRGRNRRNAQSCRNTLWGDERQMNKLHSGYLSVLFGHRLNGNRGMFWFSRWGWKGPACALVADVAPNMSVRSPGSRRLQLWMQLPVWWWRCRCQHQSLECRHLCL